MAFFILPVSDKEFAKVCQSLTAFEQGLRERGILQRKYEERVQEASRALGAVELTRNFGLAAYHFYVRGDESWLREENFQTLAFGTLNTQFNFFKCPQCSYFLTLQSWDQREFICPQHGSPLIRVRPEFSWSPSVSLPESQEGLYIEEIEPVEKFARERPSQAGLSLRIPQAMPFSEWVIAVGEIKIMSRTVALIRELLLASLPLSEKASQNEQTLQDSYTKLMNLLRSGLEAGEEKEEG